MLECSDLAVIEVGTSDPVPYFEWAQDEIRTGLDVYAAGFQLGDPEFTMTRGIVAKANARVTSRDVVDRQHDRARRDDHPGNSGGPLIDARGRVVSVWVAGVEPGSPASDTGLLSGDVITSLNGLPMGTDGTFKDYCDVIRTAGAMTMEVPAAWSRVDGLPLQLGEDSAPQLSASPDLGSFRQTFDTPGVQFAAIPATIVDLDGALAEFAQPEGCVGGGVFDAARAGLQDSAPRAALLALHARTAPVAPDSWEHPTLAQIWLRWADYVVPREDLDIFTIGTLPREQRWARALEALPDAVVAATGREARASSRQVATALPGCRSSRRARRVACSSVGTRGSSTCSRPSDRTPTQRTRGSGWRGGSSTATARSDHRTSAGGRG